MEAAKDPFEDVACGMWVKVHLQSVCRNSCFQPLASRTVRDRCREILEGAGKTSEELFILPSVEWNTVAKPSRNRGRSRSRSR
jgi:hypothetical protein